ncbi:MAG: helix-turn-helix domain-containing protein [Oscillospiraceae bacterium]|jgi:transcriptional regulator with XRE-family HTH domain|nr:helix-turn-helix domain-containing protein [Oscillospiraceae bacterium]
MKQEEKRNGKKSNGDLFKDGMPRIGESVARIRKRCGLTQANVAESLGVSDSAISRIERGECIPPRYILQAMLQLFNMSLDDALSMLLDGSDCYEDDDFNDLRFAIRDEKYDRLRLLLVQIDEKKLIGKGMYRQLYIYAKVLMTPELEGHIAINRLVEALKITKTNFSLDRISEYRLRFDELSIINGIGRCLLSAGKFDKAAKVFEDAAKSMNTFYLNERLKCEMYPDLLYNLSTCYGRLGRHKEVEQVCQSAITLAIQYNRLRILPYLLNNSGTAKLERGDRKGGLTSIVHSYFTAMAMENQIFADYIKINAENELGINLSIIDQLQYSPADHKQPERELLPEIE